MADNQIDVIIRDLNEKTERVVSSIGLGVVANLREVTPRDTSWARSNWIGSRKRPAPALTQPKGRPTDGDVARAQAASAAGEAEIMSFKITDGSLFVSNNVPYILSLNSGSSKQAGAGFVERAIERAVREGR